MAGHLGEGGRRDVGRHLEVQEQAFGPAILGQEGDAARDRIARGRRPLGRTVEPDHARGPGQAAEQGVRQDRPAGADQPGDAEHLAGVEPEADVRTRSPTVSPSTSRTGRPRSTAPALGG